MDVTTLVLVEPHNDVAPQASVAVPSTVFGGLADKTIARLLSCGLTCASFDLSLTPPLNHRMTSPFSNHDNNEYYSIFVQPRPPVYRTRPETILSSKSSHIYDPFRPYEKLQLVCKLPKSGLVVLLNRFSTLPKAFLCITEEFRTNYDPISKDDIYFYSEILSIPWCFDEKAVILKNFGPCGSQVHFHINLFSSLPSKDGGISTFPFLDKIDELVWAKASSGSLGKNALGEYFSHPHYVGVLQPSREEKWNSKEFEEKLLQEYQMALETLELENKGRVPLNPPLEIYCKRSTSTATTITATTASAAAATPTASTTTATSTATTASTTEAATEDEYHLIPDPHYLSHFLICTHHWMIVCGPVWDMMGKWQNPLGLPLLVNLGMLGFLTWKMPLNGTEERKQAEKRLENLNLADLIAEAFSPAEKKGQ